MSRECAMAAYVEEMKNIAQEVRNAYFVLSKNSCPTESHAVQLMCFISTFVIFVLETLSKHSLFKVIDNMPINEKTASFFHYFEPLYHVIHDLPRPPDALLSLRQGEHVAKVVYSSCLNLTT